MTATETVTLTEFLLARIAEDEANARTAMGHSPGQWASWTHRAHDNHLRDLACGGERLAELPLDIDEHIARHDPARVLAECEAKRRIAALHRNRYGDTGECESCAEGWRDMTSGEGSHEPLAYPCPTLRALALPYADHPDYRDAWRP